MSLWRPACPCRADCTSVAAARVGALAATGRGVRAAAVLFAGGLAVELSGWQTAAARRSRDTSRAVTRAGIYARLARALLKALGVRWSVAGAPIRRGALLAGNHVSWLDIVVMMAVDERLRMVAKSEVGGWPVIGRFARNAGTIFVDRSRPHALPATVAEVASALRSGDAVQVFPEGTTTCGTHATRWRPAFLQAAIDAGAPVQKVSLIFSTPAAAFVEDDSLLRSVRRVLRLRGLSVTVLIDEAQLVNVGRRELAATLTSAR